MVFAFGSSLSEATRKERESNVTVAGRQQQQPHDSNSRGDRVVLMLTPPTSSNENATAAVVNGGRESRFLSHSFDQVSSSWSLSSLS